MNTRRIKGDGTVRKRSDGRWEGRFTDSTGNTRYIYRYSKTEVHEELKKLGYIQSVSVFDNIGGDVDFDTWFEHYIIHTAIAQALTFYNFYHCKNIILAYITNHFSPDYWLDMLFICAFNLVK